MKKDKNQIGKVAPVPEAIAKKLHEAGYPHLNAGDLCINSSGQIYRIQQWEYKEDAGEGYKEQVVIQFAQNEELTKWGEPRTERLSAFLDDFKEGSDFVLTSDYKQLAQKAVAIVDGKESDADLARDDYQALSGSNEYAIMGRTSKEGLIAITRSLEQKRDRAGVVKAFMQKEINRRMHELQKLTEGLHSAVAVFQKQITKLLRIITTIELYLGIGEELHQIKEGAPASIDEPITFRQMVLYIDEEVGVWEDGGLDWRDIEQFDEWLIAGNNLDKVIPEKKGMVVMKPRRKDKDYGPNAGVWGAAMNQQNRAMTYFLIRNGENVYRIFTENIVIYDRFLPLRAEIGKLQEEMRKILKNDLNGDEWKARQKDKIEDELHRYYKQTLLMQGLIDRTEVFHPLAKPDIRLFTLHELPDAEKYVRFIYDEEMTLPTGRLPFREWKRELNNRIKHGTRILLVAHKDLYSYSRKDYKDRLYRYYNDYNVPQLPPPAIYEVEQYKHPTRGFKTAEELAQLKADGLLIKELSTKSEIKERTRLVQKGKKRHEYDFGEWEHYKVECWAVEYHELHLTIMYNAKDEVTYGSGGWGDYDPHERKNRLRFRIMPEDEFIFNYDLLDLKDIEFYLESRIDRRNYLNMLPILKGLKKKRIEEMKGENDFGRFVFNRNKAAFQDEFGDKEGVRVLNERIHEGLAWWKWKNQIKRPIQKDDTLALRMIEQRIKSKNWKNLKKVDQETKELA